MQGKQQATAAMFARETERVEQAGMMAVMEVERNLGYEPTDVSTQKCGYDIESRIPETGQLRFIEVKGRITGAKTVTVTKNEIITALNKPDNFILALVQVPLAEDAPTLRAANRGVEDHRIKLGCVQPGESAATFGDALR